LWAKGKADYKPSGPGTANIGTLKNPVFIEREEIPGYFTPWFWQALEIWQAFNLGLGLPFSGAWPDGPAYLAVIIRICESEHRAIMGEQ